VGFFIPKRTDVTDLTPAERTLRAKIAAHQSWAQTENRSARTANARRALLDKFERRADPEGTLAPAERARRAESLRAAHYARLAYLSARARRRRGAMDKRESTRPGGAR
jgi:hypothetical protein